MTIGTGSALAREEVRKAMLRKAEAGFLVGTPRLGYVAQRTKWGTVAIPAPETTQFIARAFVEVACNGLSLRQVTRLMRELGLEGRHGKAVSLPTVQRVLASRQYAEGLSPFVPATLFEATQVASLSRKKSR